MLIDFRVENYRSFANEQSLSMIASQRIGSDEHPNHRMSLAGSESELLRAAVIWGANGAGKSNLFKAMKFAVETILEGTEPKAGVPYDPFVFHEEFRSSLSAFAFRFFVDGEIYEYGFTISSSGIEEEWLSVRVGKKDQLLFERMPDLNGVPEVQLGRKITQKEFPRIRALSAVGTRKNQLFLTSIRENIAASEYGTYFSSVLSWFEEHLVFIGPSDRYGLMSELIGSDETFAKFAGQFLHRAGTGVHRLRVQSKDVDIAALKAQVGSDRFETLLSSLGEGETHVISTPDDDIDLVIENRGGPSAKMRRIEADHGIEGSTLLLSEESDGTRRLLNLLPALHLLSHGSRVFIIDELDRSLHPNLSVEFLKFFLNACEGDCRQLIVTTHEDRLLDLDILRRDEIWFVEKIESGASELRSLAEFKVRKDLKIDKGYLNGRFGGVPKFGHLQDLLPEADLARLAKA
ncbi:MAG: AAA family ATPase [Verrucomicrobiales bacterium]|nr:AAA family ATPase [Verrucomicrobiales bacterium]MBP9224536.1 AAA family ATPase [Verrucomicrobiales bacterium]